MSLAEIVFGGVVPADVAAAQRRGAKVIDVREPDEYAGELGHIPGALLVPLGSLEARCGRWEPRDDIIIVSRSGVRSAEAARFLTRRGFATVRIVLGGMRRWRAEGLPVAR